jgi:putative ABC transport system permease protein
MASAHDRSVFARFVAVDPTEELKVCRKRFTALASGSPVGPGSPSGSDLTRLLLARLGARPGERVALLTGDRDGVMNAVEVEVAGTIDDPGVFAAEKKVAYVPLALVQELLRMPERATELVVAVDDLARIDEVAASLRAALGPGFEVTTWQDFTHFDDEARQFRHRVGTWTSSVFFIVALLGIANTMLMSVRERTREIGTMMAVGMRRRHILALFLTEAAIIGLAGGLLGLGAGGGLVRHFGHAGLRLPAEGTTSILELHPYVTTSYMAGVLALAVVGAALAALYPALRASRLRPIEALTQVVT